MKQAAFFRATTLIFGVSLSGCNLAVAQRGCFPTVGAAMKGTGAEDAKGFRVEVVTRNTLDGFTWAHVRSCAHPEWPVRLVRSTATVAFLERSIQPVSGHAAALVMLAGSNVILLSAGDSFRMQVAGTAVEGGAVGQRVRVRIAGENAEHLLTGIVRSADTLDMVR